MNGAHTNDPDTDADTIALRALAWLLQDDRRRERFLALTGIDPPTLRARAGEPAMLRAVIDHLAQHEPDLIVCAEALELAPEAIARCRARLGRS